jgi:sialic acid synthase SpsE
MKLILDCCCNHVGSKYLIKKLIELGSSYAAYMKFQLYNSNNLNPNFPDYKNRYMEYKAYELYPADIELIFDSCKQWGSLPMFTIFNLSRLKDLEGFRKENFGLKIASPDAHRVEFINKIKNTFPDKVFVISTGMLSFKEYMDLRFSLSKEIKYMYCVSKYPTRLEDVDFNIMRSYDGFSDHTVDLKIIETLDQKKIDIEFYEKHFTISKTLSTRDNEVSITPKDLDYFTYLQAQKQKEAYRNRFDKENINDI